jgi:hypothetical protein
MATDLAAQLAAVIKEIAQLEDPTERAQAFHEGVTTTQAAGLELSKLRREALTAMLDSGKTQTDMARALDVSPSRISQLMTEGPRPARGVLGTSKVTFAIGGKYEAEKQNPVLSTEAFAAYEQLATLSRELGLDSGYEVVPPPGLVDLNRPDLVVIGSPRILPFISQVLPADQAYGWDQDDDGWFLVDKKADTQHRSPQDRGARADYAYVGRLPRPDGAGTFLYLAGIHAPGTAGAATWLSEHIDKIHRDARSKRWSVLLEIAYDTHRNITRTDVLAPLVRHDGGPR